MLFSRSHLSLAAACFTLLACADAAPTSPTLMSVADAPQAAARPSTSLTGVIERRVAG